MSAPVKKKTIKLIHRYLPSEICAIVLATLGGSIAQKLGSGVALSAYIGTVCNYVGYYSAFLLQQKKKNKSTLKILKGALLEFVPAEILDFFIIRPGMLALFPLFIPQYSLALLLGAITASTIFYLIVITSHKLQKDTQI